MDRVVIDQLPVEMLRNRRVLVRIDVETERGSEEEAPWIGERASRSESEAASEDRSPAVDRSSPATLDENKLRASLPTLEYVLRHGARVIVGTHLGRPSDRGTEPARLDEVGARLTRLLGVPVRVLQDAVGPEVIHAVMEWPEGHVVMLGNLSRYRGEEKNDPEFARQLGEVAEIYCNDAFALAHRGLASTVGITQHVEVAAAGLTLAREVRMLEAVIEHPSPPFLGLIAGARLEAKLPILEHLLPKLDRLFIGGALAFTFLKAKGYEVGAAPVDEAFLPLVHELLDRARGRVEVILPEDFVVVDARAWEAFRESGGREPIPEGRVVLDKEIGSSDLPVDIGPMTLNRIGELFDGARTILWNGPLGLWE
ncbi:MAG: phosphoglycerate kinase, partial [Acidobacteria bacterium]